MIFRNAGDYLEADSALYLVSPGLILYDILLTFPQEVNCIWMRKFSSVTILYGVIRYGTLQVSLHFFWGAWIPTTSVYCQIMSTACFTMDMLEMIAIAVYSFLRVWAVTGFELYYGLPFFVLLTGLMPPVAVLYSRLIFHESITLRPADFLSLQPSCMSVISYDTPESQTFNPDMWACVSRVASMAMDLLVLGITWKKMGVITHLTNHADRVTLSLTSIFINHGNIYFCVMLALHIPLLVLGPDFTTSEDGGEGLLYLQYSDSNTCLTVYPRAPPCRFPT